MKTSLVVVVVLAAIALGYFVFVQQAAAPTTETPTTGSEAKIDINAVCEGALAYMTFASGAEAEAWVEACKQGQHPEAIEQYKVQMGITDDRAI